ncbi:MAG TPA: hypothetical protein VGB37_16365 [Candidatus Lokiarchaeia archaeon]
MAFKLKKIKNDINGFGSILILAPFIISIVLTIVFLPLGVVGSQYYGILPQPDNYKELSNIEREAYLTWQFNGVPQYEWKWGFKASFPDFAGRWYYVYPDGTEIEETQWENYIEGQGTDPDYTEVAINMLSINPSCFSYLGIVGVFVRISLIGCIAIGLVELLWIG